MFSALKPKPFPFGLSHILYWRICLKFLGFKEHSTQNVAWDDKDDLISMCIMADISFCFFLLSAPKAEYWLGSSYKPRQVICRCHVIASLYLYLNNLFTSQSVSDIDIF